MTQYIAAFAFLLFGFGFMALMLHFSQYKKRKSTCCGDVFDSFEIGDDCDTCPNKDTDACTSNSSSCDNEGELKVIRDISNPRR